MYLINHRTSTPNPKYHADDYRSHTSCLTESERYATKPWLSSNGNNGKSKKRTPQEEWMDVIQTCTETTSNTSLKQHLSTMLDLENIPRNEKKFRNFTSNSLKLRGGTGEKIVTEIWNILSKERAKRLKIKEEEKKKQEARRRKAKAKGDATGTTKRQT